MMTYILRIMSSTTFLNAIVFLPTSVIQVFRIFILTNCTQLMTFYGNHIKITLKIWNIITTIKELNSLKQTSRKSKGVMLQETARQPITTDPTQFL